MSESVNIKAVSGSGHADHSNALSYCLLNTIPQITSTYYLGYSYEQLNSDTDQCTFIQFDIAT